MAARPRRTKQPVASNAVDIAFEAVANDPSLDSPARQVLLEQVRLARAQRRNENLGSALKVLTGVAGLVVAAALALMIWRASQADGVVIHAFSSPPDLAAEGVTGEVLAQEFIDQINLLEAQTSSSLTQRSVFQSALGQELRLEIPQTGVSIGEMDRALRGWLGHERAITGSMTRSGDQLSLTVRLASEPPISVTGPASDRTGLIRQAADRVYASADPVRWVVAAAATGRDTEMQPVLVRLRSSIRPYERAQGFAVSASFDNDPERAVLFGREAVAFYPQSNIGYQGLVIALDNLGWWEEARRWASDGKKPKRQTTRVEYVPGALETVRHRMATREADYLGDYALAETELQAGWNTVFGKRTRLGAAPEPNLATYAAKGHDLGRAAALLRLGELRAPPDAAWRRANAFLELTAERWPQAVAGLTPELAVATARQRPSLSSQLALAMAQTGDVAGAKALIETTALNCYPCLISRGQVAALGGDSAGADRWFAEAARQGPSLPLAHAEWAKVLLARGDAAGAIEKARIAAERGPKFADPLVYWGEAQLRQGDAKGAVAKFEAADKLTANWGRNHISWGEAQAKLGKTAEARARWQIAAGLDLTPTERARLAALQR